MYNLEFTVIRASKQRTHKKEHQHGINEWRVTAYEIFSYLLLNVLGVHQPLLQEYQQGGLTRLPDLVVGVGEEGDDQGEEVEGDSLVQVLGVLVAVHGDVRHLFHQLRPDTWL